MDLKLTPQEGVNIHFCKHDQKTHGCEGIDPMWDLIQWFSKDNMAPNHSLYLYVYPHTQILLSSLIPDASLCRECKDASLPMMFRINNALLLSYTQDMHAISFRAWVISKVEWKECRSQKTGRREE